jgi:dihydrofolate reductase
LKDSDLPGTKIINENLSKEINQLKQVTGKDILMFGSPSAAHSLMRENLIDDYWLFINPILLGTGIPLFKDIKSKTKLKLLDTISFSSGVVCLHYKKDVQ